MLELCVTGRRVRLQCVLCSLVYIQKTVVYMYLQSLFVCLNLYTCRNSVITLLFIRVISSVFITLANICGHTVTFHFILKHDMSFHINNRQPQSIAQVHSPSPQPRSIAQVNSPGPALNRLLCDVYRSSVTASW